MIHTDEDDEFARIEHEIEMKKGQPYHFAKRKDADDDIQDYVRPWVGLTEDEVFAVSNTMPYADRFDFAEAIEAKLKEKNT
jgi:hypothetical protein